MSTPLTRPHDEAMVELLRDDPAFAVEYLNDVFEDGEQEEVLLALRRIAEAQGMLKVAQTAKLNPTTLYRTLSAGGNPEFKSLRAILSAVGLRLHVVQAEQVQVAH